MKGDWMDAAACAHLDTNIFFPEPGDQSSTIAAKLICAGCPVREACERHFIGEDHGIFGGRTPAERVDLRNGRNRPFKAPRLATCQHCRAEFHTLNDTQLHCADETCKGDRKRLYNNEYTKRREAALFRARVAASRDAPMRGIA